MHLAFLRPSANSKLVAGPTPFSPGSFVVDRAEPWRSRGRGANIVRGTRQYIFYIASAWDCGHIPVPGRRPASQAVGAHEVGWLVAPSNTKQLHYLRGVQNQVQVWCDWTWVGCSRWKGVERDPPRVYYQNHEEKWTRRHTDPSRRSGILFRPFDRPYGVLRRLIGGAHHACRAHHAPHGHGLHGLHGAREWATRDDQRRTGKDGEGEVGPRWAAFDGIGWVVGIGWGRSTRNSDRFRRGVRTTLRIRALNAHRVWFGSGPLRFGVGSGPRTHGEPELGFLGPMKKGSQHPSTGAWRGAGPAPGRRTSRWSFSTLWTVGRVVLLVGLENRAEGKKELPLQIRSPEHESQAFLHLLELRHHMHKELLLLVEGFLQTFLARHWSEVELNPTANINIPYTSTVQLRW